MLINRVTKIIEKKRNLAIMKRKSIFYLLSFALLLAMGHILQKLVLNAGVDRFIFAFLRIFFGCFIFSLIILNKKLRPVKIIKENFRHFVVLGVFFSGCGIILKLWGLSFTTATNAAFIMSLSSLTAIFFARFLLGEKVSWKFYLVAGFMILGVYLVATGGRRLLPQKGDLIILILVILIGFMQVYGKKALKTVSVLEMAFGRSLFGMVFLGVLIPIFAADRFQTISNLPILLLVLANGITFSGSIFLFYKALEGEGVSNTGMFALLVPIITAVLGFVILHETLNVFQIMGGIIIITGSFFIARFKIKQAHF